MPFRDFPQRVIVFVCILVAAALAQTVRAQETVLVHPWPEGVATLDHGWKTHTGDDLAWASPAFDDSGWDAISGLGNTSENAGLSSRGLRWYRIRLRVEGSPGPLELELRAPVGGAEVWVNGQRIESLNFYPEWLQYGIEAQVLAVPQVSQDLTIAVRTRLQPYDSAVADVPSMIFASIGTHAAITAQANATLAPRHSAFLSSFLVDLALVLAGLALLLLHRLDRAEPGYFWLGLYLMAQGVDEIAFVTEYFALGPTFLNSVIGDPGDYLVYVLLVEFVFRFVRRPKTLFWRTYQWTLAAMTLVGLTFNLLGIFQHFYYMIETLWMVPIILLLPAQLVRWARQGNREAAMLVVPVSFIALSNAIFNLGFVAVVYFHFTSFQWMVNPFQIGPFPVRKELFAYLLFLLSIGVVMVLRFQRVSRAQARSAAELEAARLMQRRLVPDELPAIPGCSVEACYHPAAEVGGDFYQVLATPGGAHLVVVGDVSGKGLRAAMTGILVIGALRALAARGLGPAEVLVALNEALLESHSDGFVTCLCLQLDATGEVRIANAGHLAPYRNRPHLAGLIPTTTEIPVDFGFPLGIVPDAEYSETTLELAPGDSLTLMTDGVLEARNAEGELFGFERTRDLSKQSPEEVAQAAQAYGQEDDITVLTLTWLAPVPVST